MAKVHGKNLVITIGTKNVSAFSNSVEWGREADTHDTTGFGANAKEYSGGLLDGTISVSGTYDNTASTGPSNALEPLLGTTVVVIYQPEGIGTGRPTKTVSAVLNSFSETAPVADMISWTCELQMSGDAVKTTQV